MERAKSFADLISEVQIKGLCHKCGGCVTFCSAINYEALELRTDNRPQYKDPEKCIECGICYLICPEVTEMEAETREFMNWEEPMGPMLKTLSARCANQEIRDRATDGGVVTGLLLHLFDKGRIDGAIVSRRTGPLSRKPWLATTREEIVQAAGSHYDDSQGLPTLGEEYRTSFSSSIQELRSLRQKHLASVAVVGTPCQIHTLRRMEVLKIIPADVIKYKLGLFCTKNFVFNQQMISQLEAMGGFKYEDVEKINIKQNFLLSLRSGKQVELPLDQLDFMERPACRFCSDYSAEYADISFGGIASLDGWTTVILRTSLGRATFLDAVGSSIEQSPRIVDIEEIHQASRRKKAAAAMFRSTLKG